MLKVLSRFIEKFQCANNRATAGDLIQKCSQADEPHNEQSQPGHHQFHQQEGAHNLILSLDGEAVEGHGSKYTNMGARSWRRQRRQKQVAKVWREARLLIGGGETRETAASPPGEQWGPRSRNETAENRA
ncbi:hypothetical protein E2C01_031811 [Portunus trituberculatus]|uniref:Uncharacterized protein n=1 Tax=Portunus trituberculatus TaxID=210409 RepID=A0A5B7EXY5_PORTR|nr:hypothetical protein [Portunus trituberculatus]